MASVTVDRVSQAALRVVLNRPKALNSLNLEMIRILMNTEGPKFFQQALDGDVAMVLLEGEGSRAFCAGGDVKSLYESRDASGKPSAEQQEFFREEYELDLKLAQLKDSGVHQVAFYDGIVMGGGVGVSMHAPFRIATEGTVFAMPETAIGFFPDVSGSYFLPRLPGSFGMYLALTGARVKGAEAVTAGLATHYVPRNLLDDLRSQLITRVSEAERSTVGSVIEETVKFFEEPVSAADSALGKHQDIINRTFDRGSVEEIIEALKAESDSEFATKTLSTLNKVSPTSLKVTHQQVTRGAAMTLAECFAMEYRMAIAFMQGNDFYEGVHSVLVDKDHKPVWSPATLADVTDDVVDRHFAPTATCGVAEWAAPSSSSL